MRQNHLGKTTPLLAAEPQAYPLWMENYHSTYIYRDIAKLFPKLNKIAYQRFITLLGKLSGTIINKANLARAIEVSEPTIKEYLTIASGTFIWRELLSYEKNATKTIVKMPKGHMRDSGLLHYLLKINSLDELYSDQIVGGSFEGFVIEEILNGLEATRVTNWDAYYYRTRGGAEIDLILEGPFGILPIEIKYGTHTKLQQLRALNDFVVSRQCPFGLLINQAEMPEWLTPNIYQLPVGWV